MLSVLISLFPFCPDEIEIFDFSEISIPVDLSSLILSRVKTTIGSFVVLAG